MRKESVNADAVILRPVQWLQAAQTCYHGFALKFAYIVDQRWRDTGRVFKVKLWRDASRIAMPRLTTGGHQSKRVYLEVVWSIRHATYLPATQPA